MNELLSHIESWKKAKSRIFACEGYIVEVSEVTGTSKKSRYISIETDKLVARATLWESGELELEAIDIATSERVIYKYEVTPNVLRLDDELNGWLSEIAKY